VASPTEQEWKTVEEDFRKRANFPKCTGAKNGRHMGVIVPADNGSLFYNFKNYFSVVLLGVCDSKYRFTSVDIGSYGKCPDSSILKLTTVENTTCKYSQPSVGMHYLVQTDPPCQMSSLELKLSNLQAVCYIHLEERTSRRKKISVIVFVGLGDILNGHLES
jgi:hypothetical protein